MYLLMLLTCPMGRGVGNHRHTGIYNFQENNSSTGEQHTPSKLRITCDMVCCIFPILEGHEEKFERVYFRQIIIYDSRRRDYFGDIYQKHLLVRF